MTATENYCSIIHGGLNIEIRDGRPKAKSCCLHSSFFPVDSTKNFWNDPNFIPLREVNKTGQWHKDCDNCRYLEKSDMLSFRQGMNQGLGVYGLYDLPGPARLDIMFDVSCNLACRICGPNVSTFWQKHLQENNLWTKKISTPTKKEQMIQALENLDLSLLRQVVFCGGETMLGQSHWHVADWLADNVPNAKQNLMVAFQTNGTQPISERNHEIIEKLHLVKLHISLDGIGPRFEYQRWPASWQQVTENLLHIKNSAPSNVMLLIEETVSIFNLYYLHELDEWARDNFRFSAENDAIDHTRHLVSGKYELKNLTQEYVDAMTGRLGQALIPTDWKERPEDIRLMIQEIQKFDQIRGEKFQDVFPEVAGFYHRYLP